MNNYATCIGCETAIIAEESLEYYNDNPYHAFCAAVAKQEVNHIFAEKMRRQKIFDENEEWLEPFMLRFRSWEFNRESGANSRGTAYDD